MRDDPLEPAINFALRVPDRGGHLGQGFPELWLALHDEDAVWDETEIFAHRLELPL